MKKAIFYFTMAIVIFWMVLTHKVEGQENYQTNWFTVEVYNMEHKPDTLHFTFYRFEDFNDNPVELAQAHIGYDNVQNVYYIDEITISFAGTHCHFDDCLTENDVAQAVDEVLAQYIWLYTSATSQGNMEELASGFFPEWQPDSLFQVGCDWCQAQYSLSFDYWYTSQATKIQLDNVIFMPVVSNN